MNGFLAMHLASQYQHAPSPPMTPAEGAVLLAFCVICGLMLVGEMLAHPHPTH